MSNFEAAPLPWAYDALEKKGISSQQIHYHYDQHHKGYAIKLNAVAKTDPSIASKTLFQLITQLKKGPIFNLAAQLLNHDIFWRSLSPDGGEEPTGPIAAAIKDSFGSSEKFKKEFTDAAVGHFASGWCWLVQDPKTKKLKVWQGHDAANPLTEGLHPILTCDLWEHAYYIDYKNDRAAFIATFWKIVNWKYANHNLLRNSNL